MYIRVDEAASCQSKSLGVNKKDPIKIEKYNKKLSKQKILIFY